MTVFLVHHGPALEAHVDPVRPLSQAGRTVVAELATAAAARGVKPAVIWHSGKARARQTAEILWSACNPLAKMSAVRGLLPGDPPEWIANQLIGEEHDVMVVGHQPHLAHLWHALDPGSRETPFPPHGMVALDRIEHGWQMVWRS